VIGINGIGLLLPERKSSVLSMLDCITYVRDLVGVDHVGLGLDYSRSSTEEQIVSHPEFWPAAEYPANWPMKDLGPEVIAGVRQRGWSETDMDKLLGGNFLRVAQAVWK
jgi:membrane dipeptidase